MPLRHPLEDMFIDLVWSILDECSSTREVDLLTEVTQSS